MESLQIVKGALFSEDKKYRYSLWRIWDKDKSRVAFIGLNPSTANGNVDDPTIRRVVKLANSNGYGGVYMLNLFAIISPQPSVLKTTLDPVGENDTYLRSVSELVRDVVFAWGNFKEAAERAEVVMKMFPDAYCLVKNKNNTPKHPLYVSGNVKFIKYQQ